MTDVKIKKHYFKFGSQKYFRGNAHRVSICSFGDKDDPVGPKAYLEPAGKVKRSYLEGHIVKGTPVDIDWGRQSKTDVDVSGLRYQGMNGSGRFSYQKAKSARLKLINFSIDENPMKRILNQEAKNARRSLKREGKDGRIVTEVWVVVDAELASNFDGSGSITAKADGSDLAINVGVGRSGRETIKLGEGTTFAYAMMKVKKWNDNKVRDMEMDYHGGG